MPQVVYRFDEPERFVAGTVGMPGERTFFIQAREGSRLTSVVCEKQQVSVLGEHLDKVLDDVTRLTSTPIPPARTLAHDGQPLEAPINEDFRVGAMRIAWDTAQGRVLVELYSDAELDDDDPERPDSESDDLAAEELLVVSITPEMARDFAARSQVVVQAGRPPCPFCGQPIDADGHICPRSNGYRKPLF